MKRRRRRGVGREGKVEAEARRRSGRGAMRGDKPHRCGRNGEGRKGEDDRRWSERKGKDRRSRNDAGAKAK